MRGIHLGFHMKRSQKGGLFSAFYFEITFSGQNTTLTHQVHFLFLTQSSAFPRDDWLERSSSAQAHQRTGTVIALVEFFGILRRKT